MVKKYGKGAQKKVANEIRLYKAKKAKSGTGSKGVKNLKQAIAIGLSKARKKGIKIPKKK